MNMSKLGAINVSNNIFWHPCLYEIHQTLWYKIFHGETIFNKYRPISENILTWKLKKEEEEEKKFFDI